MFQHIVSSPTIPSSICITEIKDNMPPLSFPEIQSCTPTSLLDSDVNLDEVLMESLSASSNSSSPLTSNSSKMSSKNDSFQSARDRAQRLAATPVRPKPLYGRAQPLNTPTQTPQISDPTITWRADLPIGSPPFRQVPGSFPHSSPLANSNQASGIQTHTGSPNLTQDHGYTTTRGLPSSTSPPDTLNFFRSPVSISHQILDRSYAYGIRREDGTYTRLVPADQLPKMQGLPQKQDCDGLIIVPIPRAMSPLSRARDAPTVSSYIILPSALTRFYLYCTPLTPIYHWKFANSNTFKLIPRSLITCFNRPNGRQCHAQ